MEVQYLQTFFRNAYDYSCYTDCIIKLGCQINGIPHNLTNIGKALDIAFDKGYVIFNRKNYLDVNNWTVVKPADFLGSLTGKKYECTKESRTYVPKKGEFEVLFYAKTEAEGARGIGHFILKDYNPLTVSQTVRNGFLYSKRIFREVC